MTDQPDTRLASARAEAADLALAAHDFGDITVDDISGRWRNDDEPDRLYCVVYAGGLRAQFNVWFFPGTRDVLDSYAGDWHAPPAALESAHVYTMRAQ